MANQLLSAILQILQHNLNSGWTRAFGPRNSVNYSGITVPMLTRISLWLNANQWQILVKIPVSSCTLALWTKLLFSFHSLPCTLCPKFLCPMPSYPPVLKKTNSFLFCVPNSTFSINPGHYISSFHLTLDIAPISPPPPSPLISQSPVQPIYIQAHNDPSLHI